MNGAWANNAVWSGVIDGPIVLVGHSYGGAVITNAARRNRNAAAEATR